MPDFDNEGMKAGRELDALVARKVMEWRWFVPLDKQLLPYWTNQLDASGDDFLIQPEAAKGTWSPSTFSAAAWEVVEKLLGAGFGVNIDSFSLPEGDGWTVFLFQEAGEKEVHLIASTAPLAICLAALKAYEIEVPA